MLLELHIRRTRNGIGSSINMPGGVTYEFKPQEGSGDAHVCEVTDEAHIHRFLGIKEYTVFGEDMVDVEPEPEPVYEEIPDEPSEDDKPQEEEDAELGLAMCARIARMEVMEG